MSAPVLKKIHTFADDLNLARSERGIVVKKNAPVENRVPTQATKRDQVVISDGTGAGPKKITTSATSTLRPSANDLPATIITDQKGKRFNLTAEMSSAIGEWWNEKVKSVKKSNKKNVYGIPAAERRKGIVTTATTHTGRHAANDYQAVVERLKSKPETNPVETPIKQSAPLNLNTSEAAASWESIRPESTDTDTTSVQGSNFEESPLVDTEEETTSAMTKADDNTQLTVTNITYRQPRILPTMPQYDAVVEARATESEQAVAYDDPSALVPEEEEVEVINPPEPIIPTPRTFEKITPAIPATERNERTPTPSAFTLLSEVPPPTLQSKPDYVKASIATRKENLEAKAIPQPTQSLMWFAPYVAGGAFVLVTVGSIAYFMLAGTADNALTQSGDTTLPTDSMNPENSLPTLTTGGIVTAQVDAPNKTSLFRAISATANQGEGLQLVTPLAHDTALPLSSREILGLLNRQFTPAFIGSVTNVRVGMYRESPVLILNITDIATARGSMFAWESSMNQDLTPWFGVPITNQNQGTGSDFVDSKISNIDVRVLKDDIGGERLVYGFIGQSTILITTNTTAFLNVSENYNLN